MAKIKQAPAELRRAQLVHYLNGLSTRRIYSKTGTAAATLTDPGRPWFGMNRGSVNGTMHKVLALGPGIVRRCNGKRTTEIRLENGYQPTGYELHFGEILASLPDWTYFRSIGEIDLRLVEFLRGLPNFEFKVEKGTVPSILTTVEGWEDVYSSALAKRIKYLLDLGVIETSKGSGKHHYVKTIRLIKPYTHEYVSGGTVEPADAYDTGPTVPVDSATTESGVDGDLDYDKLAKSLLLETLNVLAQDQSSGEVDELRERVAQLQNEGRVANEVIKDLGMKLQGREDEIATLRQLVENLRAEIAAMEKAGYRIKDLVSDPERKALDRLIREVPARRAV